MAKKKNAELVDTSEEKKRLNLIKETRLDLIEPKLNSEKNSPSLRKHVKSISKPTLRLERFGEHY